MHPETTGFISYPQHLDHKFHSALWRNQYSSPCRLTPALYTSRMPELAEVEHHRRRWNVGIGHRVVGVELHAGKRIFRGNDLDSLHSTLLGAKLVGSEARGKQMLFKFSKAGWLGIHLGMTGELRVEPHDFQPGKHDHLVLHQRERSLVFSDPRQFGRVLFHHGKTEPDWWTKIPPPLTSDAFTVARLESFLSRRARAPIKGVLLMQECFPGVGNWMADEILWRARLHPQTPAGRITGSRVKTLWQTIRWVCRGAIRIVAKDYSDPPATWLFPHRWEKGGCCPKDGTKLDRATIGGRTTAWCPKCQPVESRRDKRA